MDLLHRVIFISLAWTSALADDETDLYRTAEGNEMVVLVTADDKKSEKKCEILTDRDLIEEALKSTANVHSVPDDTMSEILQECKDFQDKDNSTSPDYIRWIEIFPGTKWCGPGDIAKNYDDLGSERDTDMCCRTHDHCNDTIASGKTRHGLSNTSPFTSLNCQCDGEFYKCLERVDTVTSNTIGNLYFNVGKRKCYEFGFPRICKKRSLIFKKCLKYARDTRKKTYHWVDAKEYKKISSLSTLPI